jgi:hypothetical protein
MRVELDLFSGRPNPGWELTAEQSAELVERLKGLPAAKEGTIRDGLGYRGFVVTTREDEASAFTTLIVSAGLVVARYPDGAEQRFADPGRALERWLLGTAQGRLEPAVRALVNQELH